MTASVEILAPEKNILPDASAGFSPTYMFPIYILPCLSNVIPLAMLNDMGKQLTEVMWSPEWLGRSHGMNVDTLLALDYGATDLNL